MEENERKSNFMTQGIILAAASVIVRLIGILYRIPLANTIGDDGLGAYSNAFEVYNIALLLSTYSIPTAISKLISEREDKKEYGNSFHMFKVGIVFSAILGFIASLLLFVGADFIAKYQISLKECHETEYWLQVLLRAKIAPKETILPLLHRCGNIRRMLISSLNTAKK